MRQIDDPQPGFFRMRLVKGGPYVPAAIKKDGDMFYAEIDGQAFSAHHDPLKAHKVMDIWFSGREITKHEYEFMLAKSSFYKATDHKHPVSNPEKKINLEEFDWIF